MSAAFILIAMAVNVQMVMAGRAIAGFCVGIASLGLPVYLGETVQPQVRGTLGLLPTTLGNSGILLCFIAGKYLNWQMLAILGACIPIPFLVCMFLIPETPQWYISRSKSRHRFFEPFLSSLTSVFRKEKKLTRVFHSCACRQKQESQKSPAVVEGQGR